MSGNSHSRESDFLALACFDVRQPKLDSTSVRIGIRLGLAKRPRNPFPDSLVEPPKLSLAIPRQRLKVVGQGFRMTLGQV